MNPLQMLLVDEDGNVVFMGEVDRCTVDKEYPGFGTDLRVTYYVKAFYDPEMRPWR